MRLGLVLGPLIVVLASAPAAAAGGPATLVGAADDSVKHLSLAQAKTRMTLLKLAGFDSIRVTALWWPGETRPPAREVRKLANVAAAARLSGIRVFLSVYHPGARTTPLTDEAQGEFAEFAAWTARRFPAFRDVVVGNEPNLNRFWMPQYGEDGSNAAAPAYLALLARTYDALKAVSPGITVIGGALAPRGIDRPGTPRPTHSPVKFIRDLGAAYRESGRELAIMDQFAMHPYGTSSSQPPALSRHPVTPSIGLADYDKLVRVLGEAFDGTAQAGSAIPIVYGEFGVESQVPARKASLYTGTEPARTKPVTEALQAEYYRQAIELAFCQPTVRALILFHAFDEPDLRTWQSGLYYADRTAKASLRPVRQAMAESRRGVVAHCPGLALTPTAAKLHWPRGRLAAKKAISFRLACSLDCAYTARLERAGPRRRLVATASGQLVGRKLSRVSIRPRKLAPGRYRVRVSLVAPVNRGAPKALVSPVLQVR